MYRVILVLSVALFGTFRIILSALVTSFLYFSLVIKGTVPYELLQNMARCPPPKFLLFVT